MIFDVQRVGPSTGLPTRTAQGDLLSTAFLSHGDTKHIMLFPSSVEECYTMAMEAFDLAEQFQTPIFVMMDLFDRDGRPKLVPRCTYPLTGLACVSRVYTDHAVVDIGPRGAHITETFGSTAAELVARLAGD